MKWFDWVSGDGRLKLYWFSILVVALGALALRAPRLSLRPMHTDEAVHADNFGTLLEGGTYKYDPHEYHGPTLNYFTLIPARLTAKDTYASLTETTLRIVPVIFGTLLVLMSLLLVRGLGPGAVVVALLVALSPAMVFYSRYYIQEMLLVCFTFGVIVCGYRYLRTQALPWALATGAFVGLMHATKETCIIAWCSMGLALVLSRRERPVRASIKPLHLLFGLAVAVGVSALFYSSFGRHPQGVLDSYLTYATYLGRGAGENTAHVHPWYYYLQMLVFAKYFDGPIWTEGWIVLLALVGMAAAAKGTGLGSIDPKLVRFLVVYTIAMTVVYSAVRYKTPWCLLSFLHGMILLAGVGAVMLLTWVKRRGPRAVLAVLLVGAAGHLAFQAYRANFVYYADSRNPYVYAHPTTEVFTIVEKVKEYADLPDLDHSNAVPIQVIVPGQDYWPLPWYLRAYRVGWCTEIPDQVGPLVLISDKLEEALTRKLYVDTPREKRQMYLYLFPAPYYLWFRPGVKMLGFVRKDLWDERANQESVASVRMEGKHGQPHPTTGDAVRSQ
ncbi:MAG: TIGR03663 family protein [Planctomycetes bacterium]|nr:TIGR03663 family protein [Planctomycetota bacterium]